MVRVREEAVRLHRLSPGDLATIAAAGAVVVAALSLSYQLATVIGPPGAVLDVTQLGAASPQASTGDAAAGLSFLDKPKELPRIEFVDGEDRPLTLAEFRGRPVLLNVWATWCVPCRKEMPSLDRLQAKFDPSRLLVLTLSVDRQGSSAVRRFYREQGLKTLGIYVDRSGDVLQKLRLPGVPGTLLLNADGQEIGRKLGQAEWDSPAMTDLIVQRLGLPPQAINGASE
jgi:thiol-disulfide isomerase/thioredoxin